MVAGAEECTYPNCYKNTQRQASQRQASGVRQACSGNECGGGGGTSSSDGRYLLVLTFLTKPRVGCKIKGMGAYMRVNEVRFRAVRMDLGGGERRDNSKV